MTKKKLFKIFRANDNLSELVNIGAGQTLVVSAERDISPIHDLRHLTHCAIDYLNKLNLDKRVYKHVIDEQNLTYEITRLK